LALHYSDLCWFDGALYVLLRHQRCVLKVDPASRRVLAEYDFREFERQPEFAYRREYRTGVMEGLAVDRTHFWLVTDNNGLARTTDQADSRPTLFRCRRPDI
jgi:glutamine cyclotransferase